LDSALNVKCITSGTTISGFSFVSKTLQIKRLAIENTIVLLVIICVHFRQRPAPKKLTATSDITKLLREALNAYPAINSQPRDKNIVAMEEVLLSCLYTAFKNLLYTYLV
jgi:hypothetical protein